MAAAKTPRDINQLGAFIVARATGSAVPSPKKKATAAQAGRKGGKKGGPARAAALSPAKRKSIAKKAAKKRWRLVAN